VELVKCFRHGELTGEELQNIVRGYPLSLVQHGINSVAQAFGSEVAASCVWVAELPLIVDRDGWWSINEGDQRVADFPPD